MKWLIVVGLLLGGAMSYGQTLVRSGACKPLFHKTVSLTSVTVSNPMQINEAKDTSIVLKPYYLAQPERLPVFCAFEKKLYQTFKIPILVRLDDRKYDFK